MKAKLQTDKEQSMVQLNLFASVEMMLTAYIVFILSVYFIGRLAKNAEIVSWGLLGYGALMSILAIIPHYFGKRNRAFYVVSFIMNIIGAGSAASALIKETLPALHELIGYCVPSFVFLFVIGAIMFIFTCFSEDARAYASVGAMILGIVFAVVMLVMWIKNGGFLWSFGFFTSVITAFLTVAMALSLDGNEFLAMKHTSMGSFGGFLIVFIVVLFVLSEGEILDSLDIDLPGGKKNKAVKK
ncbi:MAG: hypothetical protein E7675_00220 [Ruminococcaceae bacterium]|nr:hypothetical protein [Oscillospiraceae bacterium]